MEFIKRIGNKNKNQKKKTINKKETKNVDDFENDIFGFVKENFASAVINIEVSYPRDFGAFNSAGSSKATGFIVDKVKGLVLTNKHVVEDGPCRAKGIFLKNEEIDLFPIYRDPVHDYGFFKFDITQLKETALTEIELAPQMAKSGIKALLIGNNEGEKLTFIESTVSRLNRPAHYDLDMNTFHITTSDTSVGGSSGSPLLTKEGKAIGLMAGGGEGTSYLLPLDRIVRCLEFLKKDEQPPRGTIQVAFNYQTFEALLQRNSITQKTILTVKNTSETAEGLLVVDKHLPKGPGRLAGVETGDIIISVNNSIIFDYVGLAEQLDTYIGKELEVVVLRHLETVILKVIVQDFSSIIVSKMVELSNGIFHQVQYNAAMLYSYPLEGVFLSKSGYMFSPLSSYEGFGIIKKIGTKNIKTLEDFIETIKNLSNGENVAIKYQSMHDQTQIHSEIITVDKQWYPFLLGTRNDVVGKWEFVDIKDNKQKTITISPFMNSMTTFENTGASLDEYVNALVNVKTQKPFNIDAHSDAECINEGYAVIIDKVLGIALTSTHNVDVTLLDVQLVFNESKTITAKIIYISPGLKKPFAFLKYDPSLLLNDRTVTVMEVKLSPDPVVVGEVLEAVGYESYEDILVRETVKVKAIGKDNRPIFDKGFGGEGFYFDPTTRQVKLLEIQGMYKTVVFHHLELFETILRCVSENTPLPSIVKFMPVSIAKLSLLECRLNGLSDEMALSLQKTFTPYEKAVLSIKNRSVVSDAYKKLEDNDIILSVNDTIVSRSFEFHKLTHNKDQVSLKILRDSEEIDLNVKLTSFSTLGTSRIIHFAGLIVQDPYPDLYYSTKPEFLKSGGVYIPEKVSGSPVSYAENQLDNPINILGHFIYKVNEFEVTELDEFSKIISKCKHEEFVKLSTRDISNGDEFVLDVRLDLEYWKTREMYIDESNNWVVKTIELEHDIK